VAQSMRCANCGGEMILSESVSAVGTYTCADCGNRIEAVRTPSEESLRRHVRQFSRVRVTIEWEGEEPSGREIMALKRLVPEFRNASLQNLRQHLRSKRAWDLGLMAAQQAEETRRLADQLGVTVRLEPETNANATKS
jgi:DNA-directed RNA polymerase subunit RPC12/RpoP